VSQTGVTLPKREAGNDSGVERTAIPLFESAIARQAFVLSAEDCQAIGHDWNFGAAARFSGGSPRSRGAAAGRGEDDVHRAAVPRNVSLCKSPFVVCAARRD
jgi:hypothetical protein